MRRACCSTLVGLFLLLIPAAQAQATREAGPDPAQWVPEDALFYIGITDTAQLYKDFQSTLSYKMMQDKGLEDMPASTDVFAGLVKKIKERLARLLDTQEESLKNPLAGPLAFYLTVPPGAGVDSMEPVIVAGIGDEQLMKQYFDSAITRLKAAASSYETVSAAGQTIHVFAGGKTDEAKDKAEPDELEFEEDEFEGSGPLNAQMIQQLDESLDRLLSPERLPEKLAACLAGDRLIASATPERVKSVLAHERDGKSLAGTEEHKLLLSSLKPVGQIRLLVNLPRIFELVRRDAKGPEADSVRQTFDVIGAGSLRGVLGHCRLASKSYDSKLELLFLMGGERTGLARLFSMENRPVEAPFWSTVETSAFLSLNIDPPKLVDEVLRIIGQSDPQAAEEARASLEQVPMPPEGQPVNVRKDLIDHLTGPLTGGIEIARPYGPGSLRGMLSLAHRNRDAIVRVLTPLLGQMPPRDVRGTPVYTEPNMGGSLAIGSDRLLFGSQTSVESALSAGTAGGLAEDANFRRATRVVPKEAWGVMYIDQHKLVQGLIELAGKKEQLAEDAMAGMVLAMLQMGGVDFSDADQNKKALQYSGTAIMTIATTTEGVQVTLVGLSSEEEEGKE